MIERKVTAATAAAAVVTLIVWILSRWAEIETPAEVQGSLTTLAVLLFGYLVPNAPSAKAAEPAGAAKNSGGGAAGMLLPFLALLGLGGLGACSPFESPSEAFVRAERAHYQSVSPVIRALADTDPGNDPDLSGPNGEALVLEMDTWDASLQYQESRHDGQ